MRLLPLIVALIVGLVGTIYAFARDADYESTAQLVLTPNTKDPGAIADLLSSFTSGGALGTYVELYSSEDTRRAAGDPPATITVRAVPDSRTIRLTARGAENDVEGSLRQVLSAGLDQESQLNDAWGTTVIQQPTPPERARPGTGLVLLATLVLAILAGIFTQVLLSRVARTSPPRRSGGGTSATQG